MLAYRKRSSLLTALIILTLLFVLSQITFFTIHYHVSDLIDSFVHASLNKQLLSRSILLPITLFCLTQLTCYLLFIIWVWFMAVSVGELFSFSINKIYWLGIFLWCLSWVCVFAFNNDYFSNSFFSQLIRTQPWYDSQINTLLFYFSITTLAIATGIAYVNYFINKKHFISGGLILTILLINSIAAFHFRHAFFETTQKKSPNIIFIGLDSVRPDFINYFGQRSIYTPNIDAFLQKSAVFTQAYSPLARTYPAWVTILTGQHPKLNHARNNLAEPSSIISQDNLAKRLKRAGYETIYATDEKRFSNITEAYGFDRIIGPRMGVNDFLLGNLTDFPLTNLIINSHLGKFLFPYNFGNRGAAITYQPNSFLHLINDELSRPHNQPLFLAIHLCTPHWPFTWANDKQPDDFTLSQRYQSSVEEVDRQLGKLLTSLKQHHILDHAFVVLLSDHGTTIGLPDDRIIKKENFYGDKTKLNLITVFKLDTAPGKELSQDFSINTSYGQGSDILSLKQNHVLLAFKNDETSSLPQHIDTPVSLFDIYPTILDFLKMKPLKHSNGLSLMPAMTQQAELTSRLLFLETGYSISEIETNDIELNKVVNKSIGSYAINPSNGFLYMKPTLEKFIIKNKQRAVLFNDWLLARYPASTRMKLALNQNKPAFETVDAPNYFVLVNLKTGKWTILLSKDSAKTPIERKLFEAFDDFYGEEV